MKLYGTSRTNEGGVPGQTGELVKLVSLIEIASIILILYVLIQTTLTVTGPDMTFVQEQEECFYFETKRDLISSKSLGHPCEAADLEGNC